MEIGDSLFDPTTATSRKSSESDSDSDESLVRYEGNPVTSMESTAPSTASLGQSHEQEQSPIGNLPQDVFQCVADFLTRKEAWALKRTCRGMSNSAIVNRILFDSPIEYEEIVDMRRGEWAYKRRGRARWMQFQHAIEAHPENAQYVHKLAFSHFSTIDDFKWAEKYLPSLTKLDLSDIKDYVWTPEATWTWKELAEACPALFSRLEELAVINWADYSTHMRAQYCYAYSDYRYTTEFRLSRRRDGGSIEKIIFPLCTKLKTLEIRPREPSYHDWSEYEVHQRVCVMVDGVEKYLPSTLTRIKINDQETLEQMFLMGASKWKNLERVDTDFWNWLPGFCPADFPHHSNRPMRVIQGGGPRPDEVNFVDGTYESCTRPHAQLATSTTSNQIARKFGGSLVGSLFRLQEFRDKFPHIKINPGGVGRLSKISALQVSDIPTVDRSARLHGLGLFAQPFAAGIPIPALFGGAANPPQQAQNQDNADQGPVIPTEVQATIRWLVEKWDWKPALKWDNMLCDVFPKNLAPGRATLPKHEILSKVLEIFTTFKELGVPIRVYLRDRTRNSDLTSPDGAFIFNDFKCFVGEGENQREVMAPSQARFGLAAIAPLINELTVTYAHAVPGVSSYGRGRSTVTEAEKDLLRKEMKGWRRFWARYGLLFKNLKKLGISLPLPLYYDWSKAPNVRTLLSDPSWDYVDVAPKSHFGHSDLMLFSELDVPMSRHLRNKTVSRVFFRVGEGELDLEAREDVTPEELEAWEIDEEQLVVKPEGGFPLHRFWPEMANDGTVVNGKGKETGEKRKRENGEADTESERRKRILQIAIDEISRGI